MTEWRLRAHYGDEVVNKLEQTTLSDVDACCEGVLAVWAAAGEAGRTFLRLRACYTGPENSGGIGKSEVVREGCYKGMQAVVTHVKLLQKYSIGYSMGR